MAKFNPEGIETFELIAQNWHITHGFTHGD